MGSGHTESDTTEVTLRRQQQQSFGKCKWSHNELITHLLDCNVKRWIICSAGKDTEQVEFTHIAGKNEKQYWHFEKQHGNILQNWRYACHMIQKVHPQELIQDKWTSVCTTTATNFRSQGWKPTIEGHKGTFLGWGALYFDSGGGKQLCAWPKFNKPWPSKWVDLIAGNTLTNKLGTSLAVQGLRLHLPEQGLQITSLVEELTSHMSGSQKTKT